MDVIIIGADGNARSIYSDELDGFARSLGSISVRRASHVEPTESGNWSADMSPVGGPVLGEFSTRAAALAAETSWIIEHNIPEVLR